MPPLRQNLSIQAKIAGLPPAEPWQMRFFCRNLWYVASCQAFLTSALQMIRNLDCFRLPLLQRIVFFAKRPPSIHQIASTQRSKTMKIVENPKNAKCPEMPKP